MVGGHDHQLQVRRRLDEALLASNNYTSRLSDLDARHSQYDTKASARRMASSCIIAVSSFISSEVLLSQASPRDRILPGLRGTVASTANMIAFA
jgi:hypothetical protein